MLFIMLLKLRGPSAPVKLFNKNLVVSIKLDFRKSLNLSNVIFNGIG